MTTTTAPEKTTVGASSVWTQLHTDFLARCATRAAAAEFAGWGIAAELGVDCPAELADGLHDQPARLGFILDRHQQGSPLATAILIEGYRPALMTFARYARIDVCETGSDRAALRAQTVLTTFLNVAATSTPDGPGLAGRLYGETLKRVTRERAQLIAYPMDFEDPWNVYTAPNSGAVTEKFCARPITDWASVEHTGLVRDMITAAAAKGVITDIESQILQSRFLGDEVVSIAAIAAQIGLPVANCETKNRRAIAKLIAHYNPSASTDQKAA